MLHALLRGGAVTHPPRGLDDF